MLQVRLRPDEAERLRELAAQDDEPVSALVRRAIRRYVERRASRAQGGGDNAA